MNENSQSGAAAWLGQKSLQTTCLAGLMLIGMVSGSPAGSSNSLMDISDDGRLLVCSNRDSGTVTFVKLPELKKIAEIPVGHYPEGVSFVGDSTVVACAVYGDDRVVLVDAEHDAVIASIDVFDEPYSVVSSRDGKSLFVTLEYPGQVIEIETDSRTVTRTIDAGRFVRGLAINHNEDRLYVTEYYTGVVRSIDRTSGLIAEEWPGASTDNLARQITLHPHRDKAYLPHVRSRIQAAHGSGSIFPYISVVDTNATGDEHRKRFPMDALRGTLVVANPWEVAVSPDGRRLYGVFSGTDDMFVLDTLDDDYREIDFVSLLRLGHNPRAVRVAPDSQRFYIYNALSFNVVAYDASTLQPVGDVTVCENPLSEDVLLGKILFYSANQPMAARRWISCSGCHPDGDSDGRTWQNPEGLRDTPPLFGLAWTHPLHWSSDRDEVQDFEHTIRGVLMQGKGLVRGRISESLGQPNSGRSRELDAVAAYTNSHRFLLSPHAKHGLSTAAQRGRELFLAPVTGCADCHSGPYYSDSRPGKRTVHNVGTGNDDPSELMGPEYDTPTLLGVYRSAPYLHHGTAATLRDVLTTANKDDQHGRTSQLNEQQITDLVEFLKCLPFEDPEPQAREAGMVRVVK